MLKNLIKWFQKRNRRKIILTRLKKDGIVTKRNYFNANENLIRYLSR